MRKILVDTNIFFIPFTEGVDILEEIKNYVELNLGEPVEGFYTLKKNIWELDHLERTAKSQKKRNLIKLIKKYIEKKGVKILDSDLNERTDRLLIQKALEDPKTWIVATQDSNLREALKRLDIHFIYFKNKQIFLR